MAGMLATAGLAAAVSIGTANAAVGVSGDEAKQEESPVHVNFANTRINSVEVFMKNRDGSWSRTCVKRDPSVGSQDTGFRTDSVLINSFATVDCTGEKLHADTVDETLPADPWVILLETLDDDDTEQWAA